MSNWKKRINVDFDGVLHGYQSGWQGIDQVNDPPHPDAVRFLTALAGDERFVACVYSSRSNVLSGIEAMRAALLRWGMDAATLGRVEFPSEKGPAWLTIDDRAFRFVGSFPSLDWIDQFAPWKPGEPRGETGQLPDGKLADHDDGELELGIRPRPDQGLVEVAFGKPVAWVALKPDDARRLAQSLLKAAATLDGWPVGTFVAPSDAPSNA